MTAIESPYITQADVHMRLDRTYCMYNGSAVYVTVNQQFKCGEIHIRNVRDYATNSSLSPVLVSIDDPKFCMVLPELGYVNYDRGCVFIMRSPERRQKQGLCSESLSFVMKGLTDKHTLSRNSLLFSPHFSDMIEGKYPSFKEALASIRKEVVGRAFDRNLAIIKIDRNILGLFYRNTCVGTLSPKGVLTVVEPKMMKIVSGYVLKHGIELQ